MDARTGKLESARKEMVGGAVTLTGPPGARWWIGTSDSPVLDGDGNPTQNTTVDTGVFTPDEIVVVRYYPKRDFPLLTRVRHAEYGSLVNMWVGPDGTAAYV